MRALRLGPVVLAGALLVAACGGGDDGPPRSADDLARVLRDSYDATPERARCMADQVFARLSPEEIDEVQDLLAEGGELPPELRTKLRIAITPCA